MYPCFIYPFLISIISPPLPPYIVWYKVLLCKDCDRAKPPVPKDQLFCPLCKGNDKNKGQGKNKDKYKNKNHSKS